MREETPHPTNPDWCRDNPNYAAEEIDRLRKRVAELEALAASWRDLAQAARKPVLNAEDIYAMTRRNR